MKALVIYFSHSGQTSKFAQMIATKLTAAGHQADMFELKVTGSVDTNPRQNLDSIKLQAIPQAADYDLICIGTPVWGFQPAPYAIKALKEMTGLKGKKVVPFVSMGFPLAGMGGTGSLRKLAKLAAEKGAIPQKGSVITHMLSKPELQMSRESDRIAKLI